MKNSHEFTLNQKLEQLSIAEQIAFALLLCERMLPTLYQFSSDTGFDSATYRTYMAAAWDYLVTCTNRPSFAEFEKYSLDHAPDTEDFNHPLTSAALNAALSVAANKLNRRKTYLRQQYQTPIVEAAP